MWSLTSAAIVFAWLVCEKQSVINGIVTLLWNDACDGIVFIATLHALFFFSVLLSEGGNNTLSFQ